MHLKFSAKIREELNPELSVIHVVKPHLFLGVITHQIPLLISIPPVSPPFILVPPGVPHPDQTNSVLLAGTWSDCVHPVEPRDGVGMALHKTILVCLPGAPPVSFPGAGDEGLE